MPTVYALTMLVSLGLNLPTQDRMVALFRTEEACQRALQYAASMLGKDKAFLSYECRRTIVND